MANWDLATLSDEQLDELLRRQQKYALLCLEEDTGRAARIDIHNAEEMRQQEAVVVDDETPDNRVFVIHDQEALRLFLTAEDDNGHYQSMLTELLTDERLGPKIEAIAFTPIVSSDKTPSIKFEDLIWRDINEPQERSK